MLPPALQSIINESVNALRKTIQNDRSLTQFSDILQTEDAMQDFAQQLVQQMTQAYVDERFTQAKEVRPVCTCGAEMTWHRTSTWKRHHLSGEINVSDPYAYCSQCGSSIRPLHGLIGTNRETWSLQVQEAIVDLASDESCGKAVAKLQRHHPGVEMDRTCALRLLHKHGAMARTFIKEKLLAAVEKATREGYKGDLIEIEVEFDGGMVPVATLEPMERSDKTMVELTPIRKLPKKQKVCRWEEVKLGLVQKPGEITRLYSVRPTNELDEAFDDLYALTCMKGLDSTTQVRGIADGALHIRPRMTEAFNANPFRFILDRPHAKEHLADTAALLQSAGLIADKGRWAADAIKTIEADRAMDIVAEIRFAFETTGIEELRKEANYFERNQDAMSYATYRANKWSTASSEAESAHRHVVQVRLKLAGTWWHPDNVQNILALRMLKANDWWDEYWADQRQKWRQLAKRF